MYIYLTHCVKAYTVLHFSSLADINFTRKNRRKNSPQSLCLSHMNMHTVLFHKGEAELQLQGKLYNGAMPLIQLNFFMHE